jgi:hypothetical protein
VLVNLELPASESRVGLLLSSRKGNTEEKHSSGGHRSHDGRKRLVVVLEVLQTFERIHEVGGPKGRLESGRQEVPAVEGKIGEGGDLGESL